jgi:hypothetical protein
VEEFDFEKSNARFDKDKIVAEIKGEDGNVAPEPQAVAAAPVVEDVPLDSRPVYASSAVYDAKSSFFDSLSCETLERLSLDDSNRGSVARKAYQEQRKKDYETFGVVERRHHHRGGRGGGYRGGSGGGQGGSGQSNRDNSGGRGGYRKPYYNKSSQQQQQQQQQQFRVQPVQQGGEKSAPKST